ncbi:SGNH/GDSL hydrolase family protein [Myroides odoratimimus]|uniref:SGNH/GDSL hydrolase family protein n=1 Tax=Myroides odoratimimus TaxID=76832 RepID=UPI002578BD8E|nr:SGNH/GDSL hydrolase family protein [Myroides odoratimimus]MDM1529036.1 SGNH/GDSL hydrolase family protein [Myroides odoratimimus]
MAIEKLNFEKKQDNPTRVSQIVKANLPSNQYSRSSEYNAIAEKINEMIPELNAGVSGYQGKIYPTDKKDAIGFYFAAESGTYPYAGNFTINIAEGINHLMFDGNKWDKMLTPIEAIGKVEEGNMGIVNGNEVFKNTPIIKTTNLLDKDYLKRNIAIKTDGGILEIGYDGGCYSIVDQPLEKGIEYKLILKHPSNSKYLFLVNDKSEVDGKIILLDNETVFKTTNEFYKLRSYVKMLDTQEPNDDWLNFLKITKISEDLITTINGYELLAKGVGSIDENNKNAPSGREIALETMLNSKLEYNTEFEEIDYQKYIEKDTALNSAGLIITINAKGYDIVKHMPIIPGVTKANIYGVKGVDGQRTKMICTYNQYFKVIRNINQTDGNNIISFTEDEKYICFTLKTPQEQDQSITLLYDTKHISIKSYNKIPFTLDQRKVIYKRGISLGDSITWYDGKPFNSSNNSAGVIAKGYQSYVRDYFGCEYLNAGKSGQDITQILSTVKSYNYKDFDFATLTSMANDARKGISLGELKEIGSVFDITTYYGALQESVEFILKSNPEITLFLLTGVKGWFNENGTSDVPSLDNKDIPIKYVEAIKQIASLYSLPVCDWYNESGINQINRPVYIGDKEELPYYLHPNNLGYEKMASLLISKMNSI